MPMLGIKETCSTLEIEVSWGRSAVSFANTAPKDEDGLDWKKVRTVQVPREELSSAR